jgi:hypothetical protein
MRYYLDCEFNGMGGELLSLALVCENQTRHSLYLVREGMPDVEPWVAENVLPIIHADTNAPGPRIVLVTPLSEWASAIESILEGDSDVTIITDWPDDIKYFCELIITGPGTMINVRPSIKFEMHRVDAYPSRLRDAVQHNAYWDALALRDRLERMRVEEAG